MANEIPESTILRIAKTVSDRQWSKESIKDIKKASEELIINLCQGSSDICNNAKRERVLREDVVAAKNLLLKLPFR